MTVRYAFAVLLSCAAALGGCTPRAANAPAPAPAPAPSAETDSAVSSDPGALIRMDMTSTVGVVLDDVPEGPLRDRAAQNYLAQGNAFWTTRAQHQVRLTYYRLVFRGQWYSGDWSSNPHIKGPLPLPDKSKWNVAITSLPVRAKIGNQDIVYVNYTFNTHILSDVASVPLVEQNLGTIGGAWDEPFQLPIDPELLLQRTGYACMDEFEYPAGSVFEQNTWYFYDDSCTASAQSACHITRFPQESCVESLQKHSGIQKTGIHFTRIPYDKATADSVRVGAVVNPMGADLSVVQSAMADERSIFYRYFANDSCDAKEGTLGQTGWRRVMSFSAVVQNDGSGKIEMGNVTDPANPFQANHDFEFSPCHKHYHFSHYGNFNYNGAPGSKRAFCLEDTNRFHNDEKTPLTAEHQSCEFQGIGAGWGDEYEFGIPGQWVDVTDVDSKSPHNLTFDSNPDHFLCEGVPATDVNGKLIFDASEFYDPVGNNVGRLRCNKMRGVDASNPAPGVWNDNNHGSVSVSSPGGSFVTDACANGELGADRDCGFGLVPKAKTCAAGSTVTLSCSVASNAKPQVVRICERSEALAGSVQNSGENGGVACTFGDSLSSIIVDGTATLTFACPAERDSATRQGGFTIYTAPVLTTDAAGPVTCQ